MSFQRTFSGAPWEEEVAYCRALRAGNLIYVTGTAPVDPGGNVHAPGDGLAQARRCLEIIKGALADLGVGMDRVVTPLVKSSGLQLVLEPGRSMVGSAGLLVTRVLAVKVAGAKTFVITDAGMTELLRPSHYGAYHGVRPVAEQEGREMRVVDVVGPVCETGDFLALDREMPLPKAGELLGVESAGAYGFVMASNYNARPRPPEVLVDGDEVVLVRERESYEDLVRGERME